MYHAKALPNIFTPCTEVDKWRVVKINRNYLICWFPLNNKNLNNLRKIGLQVSKITWKTYINFHLAIQAVVEQEIVSHSNSVWLHGVTLSIIIISNVSCKNNTIVSNKLQAKTNLYCKLLYSIFILKQVIKFHQNKIENQDKELAKNLRFLPVTWPRKWDFFFLTKSYLNLIT